MLQCTSTAVLMHEHQQRGIRPCEVSKRKTDTVRLHYSPVTTTYCCTNNHLHMETIGMGPTIQTFPSHPVCGLLFATNDSSGCASFYNEVQQQYIHGSRKGLGTLSNFAHTILHRRHTRPRSFGTSKTYITALHDVCSPSKRGMIVHRAPHVAHL